MCLSERTGHGVSACRQWIIEAAARNIMQDRIKACLAILGILDQHLFFLKVKQHGKEGKVCPSCGLGGRLKEILRARVLTWMLPRYYSKLC